MIFSFVRLYLRATVDLLFPRCCTSCGNDLSNEEKNICMFCTTELLQSNTIKTSYRHRIQFPINELYYLMKYSKKGKSQNILNAIKYGGNKELALYLGQQFSIHNTYDYIIPIPLHPKKLRKRGFNQAEAIAIGINKSTSKNIISRTKHTTAFARRAKIDRWKEVEQLYAIKESEIEANSSILLVDDILTTGATLTTCAKILSQFKPKKIDIAVVAVTDLD